MKFGGYGLTRVNRIQSRVNRDDSRFPFLFLLVADSFLKFERRIFKLTTLPHFLIATAASVDRVIWTYLHHDNDVSS